MRLPSSGPMMLLLSASTLLAGCSAGFTAGLKDVLPPSGTSSVAINGQAQGGRQPIVGAHFYLLETSSTAYGGPGVTATTQNASKSLLKSFCTGSFPTTLDSSGGATNGMYYVTTDASGKFAITSEYNACDTGHQVYLLSLGGNTGAVSANSAAGLMAVLGACGSFGAGTTVNMNELSTIAAAYAMAGFATDATHVGILDSTLAETGLANAFANANQLYDITANPYTTSPSARSTTPNGNGVVPQRRVNTLANVIAACVDTSGPASSQCSTLFINLQSTGATAGIKATETATEAIYMAHNPSVNSVYSVTGVGAPNPFTPWLDGSSGNGAPADFTISLTFSGTDISHPQGVAIDGNGNAWLPMSEGVVELSPTGNELTAAGGFTTGGAAGGKSLAIDATSSNVWLVNSAGLDHITVSAGVPSTGTAVTPAGMQSPVLISIDGGGNLWVAESLVTSFSGVWVNKLTSAGVQYGGSPFHTGTANIPEPSGIVNDTLGNVWISDFENSTVVKFNSSGVNQGPVDGYSGGGLTNEQGLAVDANNNVWAANWGYETITKISNDASTLTAYGGGDLNFPNYVAMDGANNMWVLNYYPVGISEFNTTGSPLSPIAFESNYLNIPDGIAVDGSGNVWVTEFSNSVVNEYIGAGTPVATPLAYGVAHSKLGARP